MAKDYYCLYLAFQLLLLADAVQAQAANSKKAMGNEQLELGFSYDRLSYGKGYWRSEYLYFEHKFSAKQNLYAMYTQVERFKLNDQQFLLGTYFPVSHKLILNLEGNFSPSALVLANNSLLASFQANLLSSCLLSAGYRHSEYATGLLQQAFTTLEVYFDDFRSAYTIKSTDVFGQTQMGQRLDLSYYYADNTFLTLTYSNGAEASGFQGQVYETEFFGIRGRLGLNSNWMLVWELGHSKLGNAYNRDGVGLGIRRIF